jgi:pyruvate,water dikinase
MTINPFRQRMRRILDSISPLNLTDPGSPRFSLENCRTIHDVIRYTHEKAIEEMFSTAQAGNPGLRGAKKLLSDIPVSLFVLDLGGGLSKEVSGSKKIRLHDIVSPSLRSLWKGLSHPGIAWPQEVRHMDWGELSRVAEGGGIISLNSQLLASFAITSRDYLNANIRFGYHFAVIDSYCSMDFRKNYIFLRFEGGGGSYEGRYLRILFLSRILEKHGFEVDMERDIIHSRLRAVSDATVENKLELIGYLLAFTPLKDMRLHDAADVEALITEFEQGHAEL